MADTGWVLAGTGANDNSFGSVAWSSAGNITGDDNSDATVALGDEFASTSNYLKGTNY